MTKVLVAGLQMDVAWENRGANYKKVSEYATKAKQAGADLFVLPEMFATGFSMDTSVTVEGPDGDTPKLIKLLARENQMAIVGGYVQRRRGGKGTNIALAVDEDGQQLSEYGKVHLFSLLDEQKVHEAGAGPRPFKFNGVETACFICYDLRFPEIFRLVSDRASIVIVIASWPASRQEHWDVLLRARAIENQVYVVGVNRVGRGGGLDFSGGTAIIDPLGNILAGGDGKEGLVMAEIDTDFVKQTREQMPFLRDRKI